MAHKFIDRVFETTTTTGTGTITLGGAKGGHFAFGDKLSNGDSCTYCITNGVDLEIVDGVYATSGNTLTRVTVRESTNSGNKVDWASGNKDVFLVESAKDAINAKGTVAFTADQSMGSNKLTNLTPASSGTDAINLNQLNERGFRKWVNYYQDSNLTIASTDAGATFDGVVSSAGQTVILGGQTDLTENGVYDINTSGGLTRRADFAASMDPRGAFFNVIAGSTYNDTIWTITSNGSSIGTSTITYNLIGFSNAIAGDGLVRSGNALNVIGTSNRVSVSANAVDISTSYVGQASITTLGTIGTGVWNGTAIAVGFGGTGTSTGSITGSASLTFTSTGGSSTISFVPGATGYIYCNGPTLTKQVYQTWVTATDGATVTFDCSAASKQKVTLGGNRTLALSNILTGQTLWLKLIQDGTGSRTVTWFSTITWPDGSPTLATAASKTDEFIIECTGSGTYVAYKISPDGGY